MFVVVQDYGYEGYGAPLAIYNTVTDIKKDYPFAISYENVLALKLLDPYEGYVYFEFDRYGDPW